ncbi:MAG: D-alanine--D-alanine ligase [Opitutales bacterium]|jgi:D-alanine-D-alanine ligase
MMQRTVVISGGCSSERDVSIRSGKAVAAALRSGGFEVVEIDLLREELPEGLNPDNDVVFPVLHGGFGENGAIQILMEERGIAFVGCDSFSSRLCMDKALTKQRVARAGVPLAKGLVLSAGHGDVRAADLIAELGEELVLKPSTEGSSVGLAFVTGVGELAAWLARPRRGVWIVEQRVRGHELTCGILQGRAMGVVEIAPVSGVYDYASKYTPGSTQYLFPAPIPQESADLVRRYSESAFAACGCRDFARADFILPDGGTPVFLEMNTIPGMTATSLLPKSASCVGLSFEDLVRRMAAPAIERFSSLTTV